MDSGRPSTEMGGPLSFIFVPPQFVLRLFPFSSELTMP